MRRTPSFQVMTASVIVLSLLTFAGNSRTASAQGNELDRISKRVKALKKVVNDIYVTEEKLHEVGDELQDMLDRTNELARGSAEQNISKPIIEAQEQILPLLTLVRQRLPEENATEKPPVRRAPRAGIGIPHFDSGKLIGQLAGEVSKGQYRLSRHLAKTSPDKATTDKLVVDMILAEEALAWEVGWPFTASEVAKLKAAGDKLTDEVYLSRRDRGLERINQRVRVDFEGVGRTPPPPFVIHQPTDSAVRLEVEKRLKELRGITVPWEKGSTAFDKQEQMVLLGKSDRKQPDSGEDASDAPAKDTKIEPVPKPSIDDLFPRQPKPSKRVRISPNRDEKPRTWTDKTGKFKIKAKFVSLIGGTVRLKRSDNGEMIELKLAELSKADQRYVEGLK